MNVSEPSLMTGSIGVMRSHFLREHHPVILVCHVLAPGRTRVMRTGRQMITECASDVEVPISLG
jgi:hypothetical protein